MSNHPKSLALRLLAGGIAVQALLPSMALASTTYYVDSLAGQDSNNGSLASPWKTISKVNNAANGTNNTVALQAGDEVLFKRGGTWRGALSVKGGNESAWIRYGAYGTGDKPKLLGSALLSNEADWAQEGTSNVWIAQIAGFGNEMLANPGFENATLDWHFYTSPNSATTSTVDSSTSFPAATSNSRSMRINFPQPANTTEGRTDVQLYAKIGSLELDACYKWSFSAKASQTVTLDLDRFAIIKYSGAGDAYAQRFYTTVNTAPVLSEAWASYDLFFKSKVAASDGRIDIFLGKLGLPGLSINFDSMSLKRCNQETMLKGDVGSIIFDDEKSVGRKVWNQSDLQQDGDFWYDEARNILKLYSPQNPARVHQPIEAAMKPNIITIPAQTHVKIQDLDLRYGGGHGVQATGATQHITIDGLDISYIGGSHTKEFQERFGNGIELWEGGQDIKVQNNRLSQVYDAALTSQGKITNAVRNIEFRNNLIINSEQCFELWNKAKESSTTGVRFESNTCIGSGRGWSHGQRPQIMGVDFLMYDSAAPMQGIHLTNNIFYNAIDYTVKSNTGWNDYKQIDFSTNCYFPAGNILREWEFATKTTNVYATSDDFVAHFPGAKDSIYTDPMMVMIAGVPRPNPVGQCATKGYVPPQQ